MAALKLKLNNGTEIPALGLGTSHIKGIQNVIQQSIDLGYRLIDTAFIYQNESDIGVGIEKKLKEGLIKREDLFIITKLWNTKHKPEDVLPAMKKSLSELRLDYVDLYLIHWPFATKQTNENEDNILGNPEEDVAIEDTWRAVEKCVKLGYAKSIGLSNFNSVQIEKILKIAEIKPVVNQVECNPYFSQEKLRKFCKERDILIMAYSPFYGLKRFASGDKFNLFKEPIIKEIAEKRGKTPNKIILRYLTQCNVVPIPKSDNLEHLKSNINIFDFTLSEEEFQKMQSLNKNVRCSIFPTAENFKEYPFNIEF